MPAKGLSPRPGTHHGERGAAAGFPPIEIDGEHFWDGGVLSNTPLDHLLDAERDQSMLVFQIDLFSARGAMPRNLFDVYEATQGHSLLFAHAQEYQ